VLKNLSRRQWLLMGNGAQALLAGVAIGLFLYAGVQIGSSYLKNYEFAEAVKKEAPLAASDSRTADAIREELLEKSQDLGLPVAAEGIQVVAARKDAQIPIAGLGAIVENGNSNEMPTVGSVNIDVSYEVPISFPLLSFELKFHCHGDDHTI
jgi:hypothetical protein